MTIADLLTYIFEGQVNSLSVQFEDWVRTSRRFRTFAETYRDKIRKKLRNLEDEEALKSLTAELRVAHKLLADQRFALEYEKYGTGKQRGPDFSLQYRTNIPLNLEVTRLRFTQPDVESDLPAILARKLAETVLDKVGQMPSDAANVLLILSSYVMPSDAITRVLADLRLKAEAKQDDFFAHRGFRDASGFLKQFRHLSLIYFSSEAATPNRISTKWLNSLGKYTLSVELRNRLQSLLYS